MSPPAPNSKLTITSSSPSLTKTTCSSEDASVDNTIVSLPVPSVIVLSLSAVESAPTISTKFVTIPASAVSRSPSESNVMVIASVAAVSVDPKVTPTVSSSASKAVTTLATVLVAA